MKNITIDQLLKQMFYKKKHFEQTTYFKDVKGLLFISLLAVTLQSLDAYL